ncbi:hypothetical protein [Nakamurella endophytica]|uniref:Uncharacterized protein n=1 Tax=Nakamurella endophytica TaxID=1748367 RepID=A0A917SWM4_9ACTN|nr:hypothetical protein [Nakamurella endophytica]GGL99811.1 hypothetical protein GCM10011594_19710 [Nakamurella endophytica]
MSTTQHRSIRDRMAARRAQQQHRQSLEQELASFATPAERLELELILSRYPDEKTAEVRDILSRQQVQAA